MINPHKLFRLIDRIIVPTLARVEIHGRENVPEGGFVVAMNHLGRLDAFLLHYCLEDRNDFAVPAAEKYENHPIFGPLGRWLGVVWIDRFNADIGAVREIISRMKNGSILVIAPEGTRSKTEALLPGKPGVAFLAARAGVPILPVAVIGTEDRAVRDNIRHLRRSHIVVRAGKPFYLQIPRGQKREDALQTATDEIMCQIGALLPEKYRGVYAEHPRLKELINNA